MWRLHGRLLRHLAAELPRWPASTEQIVALQEKQVRRLLRYAYEESAFYRRIYDKAGFHPEEFRSLGDLEKIPLTSRDERQLAPLPDLTLRGARVERMRQRRTSGSSGMPLTVCRTWPELLLHNYLHWRMYRALGNRVRDRRATVAFIRHTGQRRRTSWLRRAGFYPMEVIDILLPAGEILERLRQAQPDILICPSSTAVWLAGEMTEEDALAIRPRLVLTWGETIPEESRQEIERRFGAAVVDFYGSHEARMIAVQCRRTGLYHLFEAVTLVEVLCNGRPAAEGEEGEVVVTALWTYGMPFIRYRQRDLVRMGPERCPCGARCRTLRSIEGRTLDRIPLPDGSSIHPYAVIGPLVQEAAWVKRLQFQQEEERLVRLLLETHGRPDAHQIREVERAVRKQLRDEVEVRAEVVDQIPLAPTGKYYPYVSKERLEYWRKAANPRP